MAKGKRNQKVINHNKIENLPEGNNSIFKIFITILIVLCFLGLFYLLAIYITNKNSDSSSDSSTSTSEETTSTSSDYDNILLGSSFNKSESEYLVVYYDASDEDLSSSITSAISTYEDEDDALPVYKVDMSSKMNSSHATTDETNKNPTSASELYINGPTVIKFSDGSVSEYIEGEEAVEDYLE